MGSSPLLHSSSSTPSGISSATLLRPSRSASAKKRAPLFESLIHCQKHIERLSLFFTRAFSRKHRRLTIPLIVLDFEGIHSPLRRAQIGRRSLVQPENSLETRPYQFRNPPPKSKLPTCFICTNPVSLETAKIDEHGKAIHEECYVLKIKLKQATTPPDA